MKTVYSKTGPFLERPHFKVSEIEEMCAGELRSVGLYPSRPEPTRIERFIEKRFGLSPTYETVPDGVLGFTRFGADGVREIVIAADLEADEGTPGERRLRATLAHEAGHGLMHAYLFCLGSKPTSLFGDSDESPKILCRDVQGEAKVTRGYDGRWWEFQANQAIGGLLMPRRLVEQVLQSFTRSVGSFGQVAVPEGKKEAVIGELSKTFNVNPAVARIRLSDMLPSENERQLSL